MSETTKRVTTEERIERAQVKLVIDKKFVHEFKPADTTPSVLNREVIVSSGVAVTITNFDDGQEGQTITILGDGLATITHGTRIFTNTAVNKLLGLNKVYRFTKFANIWYEDA